MDIKNWLNQIFPIINRNIRRQISEKIADYNSRNVLNSSFALTDAIDTGYKSLEVEIKLLIEKLICLNNINSKIWDEIKEMVGSFIKDQLLEIKDYCKKYIHIDIPISGIEGYEIFIYAMLDFYIETQKQIIKRRKKEKRWDIVKMVLSAILGGTIALLIKQVY